MVERVIEGLGRLVADELHVVQIAGVTPLSIGESITIGRAVGVCRANQDVLGRDAADSLADAVAQDARKTDVIDAQDADRDVPFAQDDGSRRQVASLFVHRMRPTDAPRDRKQRIRRDHPLSRPDQDVGASRPKRSQPKRQGDREPG